MKVKFIFTTIFVVLNISIYGQYQKIVDYSFDNSIIDLSGNYSDATALNTSFNSGGIYSNGIYFGNNVNSGSYISTDNITVWNSYNFVVSLDFNVDEVHSFQQKPIMVCGSSFKFLGVYINPDSTLTLNINFNEKIKNSSLKVNPTLWHNLTLSYDSLSKEVNLMIDSSLFITEFTDSLSHYNNKNIVNENSSVGETFKGYWKNLRIYNSITTSLNKDEPAENNFLVYPNPSKNSVNIKTQQKVIRYEISDLLGGKLNEFYFDSANSVNTLIINNLESGVYFLTVYFENKSVATKKIVVSR